VYQLTSVAKLYHKGRRTVPAVQAPNWHARSRMPGARSPEPEPGQSRR
jgi:hypothetical protein